MSTTSNKWVISKNISMREAAEWVGFKFERLSDFSRPTQGELKAAVIKSIIDDLDYEWNEQAAKIRNFSKQLSNVDRGIYVLCLDGGLCVNYEKGNSRIIYIGKGRIKQRIKSHLEKKLMSFFLKIPGLQFRFYMTEPKKNGPNSAMYYHDFEHDLLLEFKRVYGGTKGSDQWPIFNKNAGRSHSNNHSHKSGWTLPLKNTNAGYIWSLGPITVKSSPKLQD